MEVLGLIMFFVGAIVCVVSGIWLLILAFRESILWGLGSLIIPLVGLFFVILHWDVAKKPFLYNLLGVAIILIGSFLSPIAPVTPAG